MTTETEQPLDSLSFGEIIVKELILQNLNAQCPPPDQANEKHTSPIPLTHQPRFAQAIHYAKAYMHDPEYILAAQVYTDRSAFSIAYHDFMHGPKIIGINLRCYTGLASDPITMIAVDDFKVTQVTFELIIAETIVERGPATPLPDGLTWRYITNTTIDTTEVKIVCRAYDKAANMTEVIERLPANQLPD